MTVRRGGPRLLSVLSVLAILVVACAGETATPAGVPPATVAPGAAASPAAKAPAKAGIPEVAVPKPAKKYTIGVAFVSGGEPWQESVKWAVQDEAKKYGVDVVMVDAGGFGNLAKQVSQIEDLVQRKVDAILLDAVSYDGTASAVDAAVAAGVPVITFSTPSKSEKVSTFVGNDDKHIGEILADAEGQAIGGKGKVALINGAEGGGWSKLRADGFTETMKSRYPDVQIVDQRWTPALDPGTSLKLAEDLLQAHPDLNGIFCTITAMAFGASQAVDAAGKTGQIALVGSSIQGKDDINLLKSGKVAAITGEPAVVIGRWGLDYTLKVLAGEKVPPFVAVPATIYTKSNVDRADFSLELAPDYLK